MTFLETDVQGSDHVCHDLMEDLVAVEDGSDDSREFIGNAHSLVLTATGIVIETLRPVAPEGGDAASTESEDAMTRYEAPLKHFREILEDWEAFILDDQLDDPMLDDELPV